MTGVGRPYESVDSGRGYTASRAWFLLPLFLGIIGGIIGCIALWNKDRGTAKMCLVLGFVFGLLWGIFFFILTASATPETGYYYSAATLVG